MLEGREFINPDAITSAYGEHAVEHDLAGREYWLQEDRAFEDRFAALLPEGGSVLDVSAGAGNQSAYFAGRGLHVTMTDGTQEMLDLAKNHVPSAETTVAILPALPLPDETFDGVFCRHVLRHLALPGAEQSLRGMDRVAKVGAYIGLVLSVSPDNTPRQGWYEIAEGERIRQYFHTQAALRGIFDSLGLVSIAYDVAPNRTTEAMTSGMPVLRVALLKLGS